MIIYGAEIRNQLPVLGHDPVAGSFLDLQFRDDQSAVFIQGTFEFKQVPFIVGVKVEILANLNFVNYDFAVNLGLDFQIKFIWIDAYDRAFHFNLVALAGKSHSGGQQSHQEGEDQSDAESVSFLHVVLLFIVLDEYDNFLFIYRLHRCRCRRRFLAPECRSGRLQDHPGRQGCLIHFHRLAHRWAHAASAPGILPVP